LVFYSSAMNVIKYQLQFYVLASTSHLVFVERTCFFFFLIGVLTVLCEKIQMPD